MVSKFPDVFPKILLGILTPREVEFTIDITPGTELISKAPYQMTPFEFKAQLEKMLEVGFICPSTFP